MNDFGKVRTGDILYVSGKGFVSWLVKKVTGGPISHVAIVFSPGFITEASALSGKVIFTPISKYSKSNLFIRRLRSMTVEQRVKVASLCVEYKGKPYSYFDILLNLLGAPMSDKWRHKFVSGLGNKGFLRCGELMRRVIYEATGYLPYKDFEASHPYETFQDGEKSDDFEVIL